ncbi:MMPL family transporter [Coralloluteibacterium thermophilus]|uniref:MMPL family transporter n=1 Tax=Coralloluteibacterium thermophilum TaxID=2707049 RepID=A0ABV9NJJ7_9GAMM
MTTPSRRLAIAAAWLFALALLGGLVASRLELSGDLRLFMPSPQTPAQALVIEELGEGPGSRLLLLAIEGAEPEVLAEDAQALRAALEGDPAFELVANGEFDAEAIPPELLPYRYLLTPSFDDAPLDAARLREALGERLEDLASPAAPMVEPLVPRDPTLEMLTLAESWQPPVQPELRHGVWFDRDGRAALLLVETAAAGFDPDAQQAVLAQLQATFEAVRSEPGMHLTISGPGAFSVLMRDKTSGEASTLGAAATVGMVLLLLFAYRSWRVPLVAVLPLASAALVGLAAVSLAFGSVHGITLAFGFTLIGVAQDYPVHLLSHRRTDVSPWTSVRALWPTLLTGVVSTCLAYLAFFISGVEGLKQLGLFTICGLLTAAATTRFLLPALLDTPRHDPAESRRLDRAWSALLALPRPRWLAPLVGALALAVILLSPRPWWENDLAALTPVPEDLLLRDAALRQDLGAPDVRWMMVVHGADAEAVLARETELAGGLDALVAAGDIAGYDTAARYLPPVAVQRARQAALPDAPTLEAALAEATADLPFRAGVFAPFLADVATARAAAPLTPEAVADTPLALSIEGLLLEREQDTVGLVTLSGVDDPAPLMAFAAAAGDDVELLDLKDATESLVAAYRERVLAALGVAALLLAAAVWIGLRDARRVAAVLVPVAVAMLVVVAVLHGLGVTFNLFHLIALILGAGLGLDYALFFEHARGDRREQLRTFHAVLVCGASTLLVFALLGLSSIPVLRAIGTTVGLAVLANFALAVLTVRIAPPSRREAP